MMRGRRLTGRTEHSKRDENGGSRAAGGDPVRRELVKKLAATTEAPAVATLMLTVSNTALA